MRVRFFQGIVPQSVTYHPGLTVTYLAGSYPCYTDVFFLHGVVESLGEFYPQAAYQRCTVHFYRNVWSLVPSTKVRPVAAMLKAIHACEDLQAARAKVLLVVAKLHELKLPAAAALVQDHIEETFSYFAFPSEHWRSLRANNPLERIMREIRRRTRVVGAFPDGNSALLLVSARLRYIAGKTWGSKRYLDMSRLLDLPTHRISPRPHNPIR